MSRPHPATRPSAIPWPIPYAALITLMLVLLATIYVVASTGARAGRPGGPAIRRFVDPLPAGTVAEGQRP